MPSGYKENLVGQVFGRLTLLERHVDEKKKTYYLCECNCEHKIRKLIRVDGIKSGAVVSCGCYNNEIVKKLSMNNATHGMSKTRLYGIFNGMKTRCYNINEPSYKDYGARGVTICDEWLQDYMNFHGWAMSNGYAATLSIDRIDVNGNYEPINCRWITEAEQKDNKTTTVWIDIDGVTKTCRQWDREYELPKGTVYQRYRVLGLRGKELIFPVRERVKFQSGVKGISWHPKSNKWRYGISENNKKKHMGYYEDLEEAIKAKNEYEQKN